MKKYILIICFGFMFFSGAFPSIQNGKFRVEGTIDRSFDGQLAVLSIRDDNQTITRSDTSIIDQGRFLFEGSECLNNLSSIIIQDKYGIKTCPMLELLLESGLIFVSFTKDQPYMCGSPLNDAFRSYLDSVRYFRTEIAKIEPKWENEIVIFPGTELERLYYAQGEYMMNFTKQNYTNQLGKLLFVRNLDIGLIPVSLYISENKKSMDEIFAFVNDEIRAHPRFISYMKMMKKVEASSSLTGTKIENFSLLTLRGKSKLSEFIGKKDYVFLEFWASWCEPCLASIPKLKEIYAEYSDKLEIVSISLDTQQTSWINALNVHNMPWPQLVNLKGFDSDIAKTFGAKSIPFGLLLDKQGVVIAKINTTIVLESFMKDKSK